MITGTSMRCDSHVHIIGPIGRYPQLATRTYLALPASLDVLSRSAAPSGIERFVIVQPSFYGADNTVLLESLDVLGLAAVHRNLTAAWVRARGRLNRPANG
jgi:predicted TIM-barrel fold metal-dependent hydrolase